ncbi:hypothetical protein EON67_10390 [archaeon]|nr:MAG: hypothetical protein EON67_10390 [archaeon]
MCTRDLARARATTYRNEALEEDKDRHDVAVFAGDGHNVDVVVLHSQARARGHAGAACAACAQQGKLGGRTRHFCASPWHPATRRRSVRRPSQQYQK